MPQNLRNLNGFSAVELVAVLVLMSLVSALALPALSRRPKAAQLATATQAITIYDSLARSHAQAHRVPVTMTIIPTENLITLSTSDNSWGQTTVLPSSILIARITVDSNTPTTHSVSIPFSSVGWSAPYKIELSLIDSSAPTEPAILEFNAFTGLTNSTK